jgi:hypothetical protein
VKLRATLRITMMRRRKSTRWRWMCSVVNHVV